jgi:hypothetical protein
MKTHDYRDADRSEKPGADRRLRRLQKEEAVRRKRNKNRRKHR